MGLEVVGTVIGKVRKLRRSGSGTKGLRWSRKHAITIVGPTRSIMVVKLALLEIASRTVATTTPLVPAATLGRKGTTATTTPEEAGSGVPRRSTTGNGEEAEAQKIWPSIRKSPPPRDKGARN